MTRFGLVALGAALGVLGTVVARDVRLYWPSFIEQIDLARFEVENGGSPFVRP